MDEKPLTKVITYGTFDLLHAGHLNILQRAKAHGDYLVVGVTGEDYDRSRGKLNVVQSLKDRIAAVRALDIVDEVIVERDKHQKPHDIQEHNIDRFVLGDDWVGKFDYLSELCEVIYLPRTEGISSTQLRQNSVEPIRLGVIGSGRIAGRFIEESRHVNFLNIRSVMSTNLDNVRNFANKSSIDFAFDDLDQLLDSGIDAVYIASPHQEHYSQAKKALLSGKHVLCEKPICLNVDELEDLKSIAREKRLILLEAVKTAFLEAFAQLQRDIAGGAIGEVQEVKAAFSKLIDDRSSREWTAPFGGSVNELASYPLLLSTKILGPAKKIKFKVREENGVDGYTTIILSHAGGKTSILNTGIGVKTEGSAIISGTRGYIRIPAPWWLTKEYSIHDEDPTRSITRTFDFDGDGLRYEIAEFVALAQRSKHKSKRLKYRDMKAMCEVISYFNDTRRAAE